MDGMQSALSGLPTAGVYLLGAALAAGLGGAGFAGAQALAPGASGGCQCRGRKIRSAAGSAQAAPCTSLCEGAHASKEQIVSRTCLLGATVLPRVSPSSPLASLPPPRREPEAGGQVCGRRRGRRHRRRNHRAAQGQAPVCCDH